MNAIKFLGALLIFGAIGGAAISLTRLPDDALKSRIFHINTGVAGSYAGLHIYSYALKREILEEANIKVSLLNKYYAIKTSKIDQWRDRIELCSS